MVAKPNAQINQVLASSEMKTRLQGEGTVAMPLSTAAFGQLIAREIERWRPVVKAANIQPN